MVAYAFNSSTQKAEAGGSQSFKTSLRQHSQDYIVRPCYKQTNQPTLLKTKNIAPKTASEADLRPLYTHAHTHTHEYMCTTQYTYTDLWPPHARTYMNAYVYKCTHKE